MAIASAPVAISYAKEQSSRFLRTMHRELALVIVPEMEATMKVAVMSAAGVPKAEIRRTLTLDDIEMKMILLRLQKIAGHWA